MSETPPLIQPLIPPASFDEAIATLGIVFDPGDVDQD